LDSLNTDSYIPFSSFGTMVIDPINPNRMYVTTGHPSSQAPFGNYPYFTLGIYATDDGGVTWQQINNGLTTSNLFNSGTIFNLQIDPNNHANLIFTSTDGVFYSTNADQLLLNNISWTKDPNFTFPDSKIVGLTYNPTTLEWFVSGKNIYVTSNPFLVGHTWNNITGTGSSFDISSGFYPTTSTESIFSIKVMNSAFYPNDIFALVFSGAPSTNGYITILKLSGLAGSNNIQNIMHKYSNAVDGITHYDMMAFAVSPNVGEFYYGSTDYGHYSVSTNVLSESYGNCGIGCHHADVHSLYIHPSQPSRLWLCGDGGISIADVISNTHNSKGFTFKNKGIQSQLLYDFDDSEQDEDYQIAALQDNGTQFSGGMGGNIWKEAWLGGDGYNSDILDYDPTDAIITGNSNTVKFNYITRSLGTSPVGVHLGASSYFSDPHFPQEKIFIGDWNLVKTHNSGTLWGSTGNYATAQITLAYSGRTFCVDPNTCGICRPRIYKEAHQNYCGTSAPAYGISSFAPSTDVSCGSTGIPSLIFKSTDGFDDVGWQDYFSNINAITNALYNDAANLSPTPAITATDLPNLSGITCNPIDANKVWVCCSSLLPNFKVWKSIDGGLHWQNADPNAVFANIPVYEIAAVNNANETVFVATLDGVYYTDNTMNGNWCHYGNSPSVQTFNLKINYVKNKLIVGTYGRGAFELDLPPQQSVNTIINTTTTWNTPHTFPNSSVVVKANSTLTILNTTCYFGPFSRIYVEAGAKLIINNSTLTADQCSGGNYWLGIELEGNINQKQVLSAGYYPNHGWCVITNNGTIKGAKVGVKNYATINGDGETIDYTKKGGGIVQCTNAKFINCKIGAKFIDYINKNALNNPINEKSFFNNTQFLTDKTVAPMYHSPNVHLSMTNTKGIGITSNTFKNLTPASYKVTDRGLGISSYDAVYEVATPCISLGTGGNCLGYGTPNSFENLFYAVEASASLPTNSVKVNNASFTNNLRGVTLHGIEFAQVIGNTINLSGPYSEQSGVGTGLVIYPSAGIYLDGCDAYAVMTNTIGNGANPISNLTYGIVNSFSDYKPNELKQNKFSNIAVGIQAQDNNDGLQLKCNKFTTGTINSGDIKVIGQNDYGTIATEQGFCTSADPTTLSGNEFSHTCGNAQDLRTGVSVNNIVNYNTRTGISLETPQLGCYNSSYYNILDCSGAGTGDVCPPSSGGQLNIPQLTIAVQDSKQDVKNLQNILEAGDKIGLYNAINNGNDNHVKNKLLQQSPYLSDNVLLAFLTHVPMFTESTIKAVLIANSPLTPSIIDVANKLTLSAVTKNELKNAQVGTSQRAYTERNLTYEKNQLIINYNYLLNACLNDLNNDNRFNNLLNRIDYGIKPNNRALKVAKLIEEQQFGSAQTELDSLQNAPNLKAHLDNLIQIRQNINQKAAYKDNIKLAFDSLKAKRPLDVGVKSQSLYNGLFIQNYGEQIYLDATQSSRLMNEFKEEKKKMEQDKQVGVYPNPAQNELYFVFDMQDVQTIVVSLYDINGRLVGNKQFENNNEIHKLELNELTNGIYFYQIIAGDKVVKSNKVVIIK